jgi:RimJ/RimL family protein N-acetyltransferase
VPFDDDEAFAGDPTWRATRKLRDGTPITIRPVVPSDRDDLRRGFLGLSPESRNFRFLNVGAMPTDDLLTYLTSVDQKDHVAIGATLESPDLKTERGIGIARFVRLSGAPDTAEAAITVADDMHRRGVATALLHELIRSARVHGIRTVRAEVHEGNQTMRAILERAGASAVETADGTIAYDLAIQSPRTSLFDVLRGAAETMALRFSALSAQARESKEPEDERGAAAKTRR